MTDLLYLAFNRLEFTRLSFETMVRNTDWEHIQRLIVYDDGSTDGTREYFEDLFASRSGLPAITVKLVETDGLGPVGIMGDYLRQTQEDGVFIKIDNDVMLPPGWLNECLAVLRNHPELDLLGIEAMRPLTPHQAKSGLGGDPGPIAARGYYDAEYIGGIGLMRRRVFARCLPTPRGRFGFTGWQQAHPQVKKGWLDPAIPVCLLNLVPFEPWLSLSKQYVRNGWQRDWPPPMPGDRKAFWEWWT